MMDVSHEKQQLNQLKNYVFVTVAILFLLFFVGISLLFLYFPMIGILDVAYTAPKIAIFSFLISVAFSFLTIKNLFGKLLLIINIVVMLFMLLYGA